MNQPGAKNDKTVLIIILVVLGCFVVLCSVVFMGIFAAIALPNFIGAQTKAKIAMTKANMRTTQIAVEMYAQDHGGIYPKDVDNVFKSYFPGGDNKDQPGTAPSNPFTGQQEWPTIGQIKSVKTARCDTLLQLKPGEIQYTPIFEKGENDPGSYAITGGNAEGHAIEGNSPGTTLVLSNQ